MGDVTRTVYGIYYPETRRVVDELWASRPHGWYERNYTGRQDPMHLPCMEAWRAWVAEAGVALGSSFPHAYPTAGASEAIHALLALHRAHGGARVHVLSGEYEGYGKTAEALGLEVVTHARPSYEASLGAKARAGDVLWLSQPSAIDGNVWGGLASLLDFVGEKTPGVTVVVDLTYVGAVASLPRIDLDHPCVAAVVWSLSKPFGVYYHRVGGVVSRAEIATLRGHHWFKNLFSLHLGERLMAAHRATDLPRKYRPAQEATLQAAIAAGELPPSSRPSDVVMLAHGPLAEGYEEYARAGALRACLSPGMDRSINR